MELSLDIYSAISLVVVGVFAGFLNVVAGGGSLMTLPVMIFMGLPPNVANATNRVAILMQNVFAIRKFNKSGFVDGKYSIFLGLAAVPGAVLGAILAIDISGALFSKILSVVMIIVGITILTGKSQGTRSSIKTEARSLDLLTVLIFFLIGMYGGFIHAGVGFIIILSLEMLGHTSMAKINSIKVYVAFVYTLSVVLVFFMSNVIHWGFGLTLAIGTSFGGWLGSYFTIQKEDKWIKRLLFLTIIGLSIKLWFYH